MRLELVRVVADWLGSDVNIRIATVPRDAGDPVVPPLPPYTDPAYPGAGGIAVFDETRHPWVGDLQDPPAAPALYVVAKSQINLKGEATPDGYMRPTETPATVSVLYLTGDADTAAAVRNGNYTLRAIARSVRELSKNVNYQARQRNGINVVLGQGHMVFSPILRALGNFRISGAVTMNYYARDEQPSY